MLGLAVLEERNVVSNALRRLLMRKIVLLGASVLVSTVCSSARAETTPTTLDELPQRVSTISGAHECTFRDGRVFIAGQPSEAGMQGFAELGVTLVVSTRTPKEMENREVVAYDEAAVVTKLGMAYAQIPLGGAEHPYTPDAVEQLHQLLQEHDGPVLLHCGVGGRAAYLWVAYLVRYQGLGLDEAMAHGKAIAIHANPLEGLLGEELRLTRAEERQES